jgi:glycosyltransferase involved in cell wall biosynthesis
LSYLLKGQKKSIAQMLSKTDVLITSSQSELDRIKLDFPEFPAQNHIIPLGISAAFLNTHHFNQERKGILLLGRLEWLKNQKPFIEWAAKYNWPLTVVGDANVNQPNYYKECREVAGPNTTFLPFTKESEVVQLMQQHSILVVPSLFETYSLVGWEACAQGMHVLFNDVPDMSETLAPVGSAVDFSDENEVRKAIEIALEEPTETQKKSQELAQRHSWDLIIQQILKAYA